MRALWENLRRRAHGPAEVFADLLRLVGLVGIPIAAIGWGPLGGVSLALATGAMAVPRALRVRPGLDIAFGIVTLIAVWSSVIDLYVTVRWWDLPVHFALNGLVAALAYLILVRFRVVADEQELPRPRLSTTLVTTALGLSFGVLWEMFEWFGHHYIDRAIYVGYTDSIGDLLWGGAGSVLAGLAMPVLAARPERRATATPGDAAGTGGPVDPGSDVSRA